MSGAPSTAPRVDPIGGAEQVSSASNHGTDPAARPDRVSLGPGRLLLIFLAAGLHALAFPPWGAPWLAGIALIPFFLALRDLSPGRGLVAGLVWGCAAIWSVAYWVPSALIFYYQQPWWFGLVFCLVGSAVLWGSCYGLFALAACWLTPRMRGAARVVLVAALWVACEYLRAWLVIGEPWMLLGYTLVPYPLLIQAADMGGVYLISFLIVLVNLCLLEALLAAARWQGRHAVRALVPAAIAACGFALYGAVRLAAPLPEEPRVRVSVIQGNNNVGMQWREQFFGRGLETYLRMSVEAVRRHRPEVLVWPESAVTFFLADEALYRTAIAQMLAAADSELIVGGPRRVAGAQGESFFNSAFLMAPDAGIAGRYDKRHLLPFAEYFPLQTIDFLRRTFERVRTFTPGAETPLLDTRMGRVAVVVCFEAIFPELVRRQMARGADVLVNLSNDAWLGTGGGPEQHLSMVAFRAVENRTWVIRATNTGISALIDPRGRIHSPTGTMVEAFIDGEVVPMSEQTIYRRVGDLFALACLIAATAALLITTARELRVRTRS